MPDIEWVDPPRSEVDEWNEIAETLIAHPGKWARVKTGVWGVHSGGESDPLEARGLETRYIKTEGIPGTYGERGDIYARAPQEAHK